jgi:acetyl esterase
METTGVRALFERTVVAVLGSLPPPLQRLLAGRRVRIDGLELDPSVQLILRLARLSGHRSVDTMTPAEARDEIRRNAAACAGALTPVARIEATAVPGPAGAIPARLYVPAEDARGRGLLIYYHGGGWVVGDLDTHDPVCRFFAREADVTVLAVEYRRAPEHRFPAAVDDALAAARWAAREADSLGIDPARLAVAGDSAGGNLAAVVAQRATREGGPRLAAQLLVYPVTDVSRKHPSYSLFREGFFLTEAEMDWYRGHYLPDDAAARDPRASPLLAPDLRGLPPAMVLTAGFDVLRDEGEAYARRMEEAGVRVALRRQAGLIHGFCNATAVSRPSLAAMREAARWLAAELSRGDDRAGAAGASEVHMRAIRVHTPAASTLS